MVKRILKFSKIFGSIGWKIFEIFLALIFVLGFLVLYHLHQVPIDAMKYMPEIEKTLLPADSGYHLQTESVVLTSDWSRDGLIQIDIKNLKVLRSDDSLLFSAPSAHFSYDLWHILSLNYMPSTIILEAPFLEMIVDETGTIVVKTKDSSAHKIDVANFKKMLARILAIRELRVTDASFHLKDNRFQQEWDLSDIDLELERRFRFSNRARLNATLTGQGVKSRFLATAKLNRWTRLLTLETGLDEINLQKISAFIPVLQEANLDVQVSAKAEFDINKTHKQLTDYISKVQFNAKTLKSGTLNLMGELDNIYQVDSADINGSLGAGAKTLKIASSTVKLKDEKPADFYLDVTGIDTFLNSGDITQLKTILRATLYDVPTGQVPALWPSQQGPDAHAWVKENLSQGKLTQADFTLYFRGDELIDLLGDIHAEGVRVDYLSPMQAIDNVSAQVLLYPDKVRILADKGSINNLILDKADLLFTDLDKEQSDLKIDLEISGPVKQALELISSKPLEFPQMFDLKPSLLSGNAKTFVSLFFPLIDDLSTKDVLATVHADITDVKVNAPLDTLGIKNGTLSLDVSNEGLEISGNILMKNSPLTVFWHEYFDDPKITSKYAISGTLIGEDIGQMIVPLAPLVKGKLTLDLRAEKTFQNLYSGSIQLDGLDAWMDLAPLAVQKEKAHPLTALFQFSDINSEQGKLTWNITGNLNSKSEKLELSGQADWTENKKLFVLDKVLAGANQFSGKMEKTPETFSLTLKGKNWQAYDLGKLSFENKKAPQKTIIPPDILLDISLEEFTLNKIKPLKDLNITGNRRKNLWQHFHLQAQAKEPFVLVYEPKLSQFQGSFSDLGDLMDRLNFTNRFFGGALILQATQDKTGLLDGKIFLEKTELKETGFLMQALTILGIVDAFRGKDIVFDEIEIPFIMSPDFQLKIQDAYAVGTNLGITFKGLLDFHQIDLSGAVVPAYALNSLPGKIPLVGWIFRDSIGGGLINVPFTVQGKLSDPVVNWNALKTVAPGVLGKLFQ